MSIEDNDIDALLDGAKLDADDGPALPLDRPALDREVANLFAKQDALLSVQKRRWLAGAAIGGVLASVSILTAIGSRESKSAPIVTAPVVATSRDEALTPAPVAAPSPSTVERVPAFDVGSLPTASHSAARRVGPSPSSTSTAATNEVEQAEDLLRKANGLRAEKNWADATKTYERVVDTYSTSGQAYPAMVAAAGLRLDRLSDPAGALRLYRRALDARPGGALAEEARFGEARALRALGKTDDERASLQKFLSSYPSSWRAEEARTRLRALGE